MTSRSGIIHVMKKWLQQSDESFQALLALLPELRDRHEAFLAAVESHDAVPDRVYTLCRALVRQIHGQLPDGGKLPDGLSEEDAQRLEQGDFSAFTGPEQTALTLAGRMPYQHHQMLDEEVAAVRGAFGDAGCVSLLTALAFFDASCRLEISFDHL